MKTIFTIKHFGHRPVELMKRNLTSEKSSFLFSIFVCHNYLDVINKKIARFCFRIRNRSTKNMLKTHQCQ